VVIPENIVFDGAEAGVVAAFEQSVEWLIAEGASVSRITIPAFDEILALMAKHGTWSPPRPLRCIENDWAGLMRRRWTGAS
jgi:Asp-tRNA(Asn)/Glu-tRNA(Gln) amidotransferase A subunit family amidase